jgi:hypothetical protein
MVSVETRVAGAHTDDVYTSTINGFDTAGGTEQEKVREYGDTLWQVAEMNCTALGAPTHPLCVYVRANGRPSVEQLALIKKSVMQKKIRGEHQSTFTLDRSRRGVYTPHILDAVITAQTAQIGVF